MKTLLLSFGLGLAAVLQAQTLPTVGEDEERDVSGVWYLKATASNKRIPARILGFLSMTAISFLTLEGGHLEMRSTAQIAGRCREISIVLKKTDEPGKYTAYGKMYEVYIIKPSTEDHLVLYGVGKLAGYQIQTAKLVGRDPAINLEALKDFENVTESRGLNSETIVIPTRRETCSPVTRVTGCRTAPRQHDRDSILVDGKGHLPPLRISL